MAGDWMKMRTNLWDDPRVSRLCDLTSKTEATVIGALYWLWATADEHSEDGSLPGYTIAQIDRKTAVKGFGKALVSIGWLIEEEGGVSIARFAEHNGASAKSRALTAKRVADHKQKGEARVTLEPQNANAELTLECDSGNDANVSGALPREEKRRKEKNNPPTPRKRGAVGSDVEPAGFTAFWAAWPAHKRKADRTRCLARWIADDCEPLASEIVDKLAAWVASDDWTKDGGNFIPAPLVWLNQRRYDAAAPESALPPGVVMRYGQATIGGFVP